MRAQGMTSTLNRSKRLPGGRISWLAGLAFCLALPTAGTAQTPPKPQAPAQVAVPTPVAAKAFVREDLAAQGAAIEERLKRDIAVSAGMDATRLLTQGQAALAKNDARSALTVANQAVVAAPNNPAAWRLLAKAAKGISPRDWKERYDLQERAVASAYIAYQRARTKPEEAQSLAVLADVFEWREMWRPALTSYRLSLEAKPDESVQAAYEALRQTRGFRLTQDKVDADSASPRACFTFSEPLARGKVDFAPYIAITGKGDFAVQAEDSQLCVDGLKHGERYAFVLRQGIPSVIPGETLLKSADYEIYVRDRTPSVRASGKTYVLPRTGQQGIPLTSVNTDKLGVRVLKIGDRNLINTIRSPEFLEQMEHYQVQKIIDESGRQIWQGVMDVKTDLNKDVITAFPALEAAGRLEPGIYVLAAQVGEWKAPAARTEEEDSGAAQPVATQWFVVSDLGLTAFSGPDGLHVLVRSLADASPVVETQITLIARNNEILGTLKTDKNGHAKFDPGLSRGEGGLAPGLVSAQLNEDFGFLDVQQTAFDLTDRGVTGRVAPKGLDAFVFAERGVYRSGETVHLAALLRDARGAGVTGMPLTMLVRRPDGMDYRRVVVDDHGGGGRALSVPLLSGVPIGTWRVQVFSDPKRPAIGETSFLVEDYVPERLEITIHPKLKTIKSGTEAELDVDVRYLYGAPGADLAITGEVTVRRAKESAIPGFAGYRTGIEDEPVEPIKSEIESRTSTDDKGKASLSIAIKEPETNLPLEAEFTLTANETGGRGVTRAITLPLVPKGAAIGVKPLFTENELGEGATAKFAVIMAQGDGKRLARSGLKWQISKISRNYQWFFKDGRWGYEAIKTARRIADGDVSTLLDAPTEIAVKIGWGTYRVEVSATGAEEAQTAFDITVGYVSDAKADTPDVLDLVLDKKSYADGETMQVRLNARVAGKATLAVMSDRLAHLVLVDLPSDGTSVPVKVSAQWGAGAYLVALAHHPLDQKAQRMPSRAIGVSWFSIGRDARTLNVKLNAPALARPRGPLTLPITIANMKPGEEAFVTVAAVDVGIVSLTRYQAPNPSEFFFGQRQLSFELRDLYSYLIDGMQGTRGQIRTGGDAAPNMNGEKPTQEPLARFSGVVKVGADGSVPIAFDLPAFNGSVRVMATAWTKDRTGEAQADVLVRDPIVVQPTVPRFLALGDKSRLHLDINAVEGETGIYALDVEVRGPIVVGLDPALRAIKLEKGKKTSLSIPVTAAGLGMAELDLTLKGGGHSLSQTLRIPLRASAPSIVHRTVRPLPGGQSLTVSNDLLSEFVPQSGAVSVSASPFAALDVPALLTALDRYPYGCTEQTISRAMPLLYVNKLASMESLALDDSAEARIIKAVERVLARQGANGSFGLWSVGGEDIWLDAFVTDFLTRVRERNIAVPQLAFTLALDRLRNKVANADPARSEDSAGLAYAIYVLARNGRPIMGDLRYLVDNKLSEFDSPLAQGQLGAALALLGDRGRAAKVFDAAQKTLMDATEDGSYRPDYGSKLRDSAGLLALLAESQGDKAQIMRVSTVLEGARQAQKYTSTQDQSWMILAAQALAKEAENFSLTVDGTTHRGAFYRTLPAKQLDAKALTLRNDGSADARVILSVSGQPITPEPALEQGYRIERVIHTFDGAIMAGPLEQNQRYVVVLKVSEPKSRAARLLVVDPLPAGLEIENANLGDGASTEGLVFLGERLAPETTEARDDRFVAAFQRTPSQKNTFTIAYITRAVTPGRYVHPAATVEDMYRPEKFGRTGFEMLEITSPTPKPKP